jgi:monofunctional biosynthetic peptidoglycan transglycosylase
LVAADVLYLWSIWPDWKALAKGPIPKSAFIRDYEADKATDRKLPRLAWYPINASALPRHVTLAVLAGEDASFFAHDGIDWAAVHDAAKRNWQEGEFERGGSTISQQTAKNLFLSPSRNPLRKWHELWLTWGLEQNLSKTRILNIYINIVELGVGVYGIEAAAQRYFGKSAAALSYNEAAELAASLPNPRRQNPASRTPGFIERRDRILRWMRVFENKS